MTPEPPGDSPESVSLDLGTASAGAPPPESIGPYRILGPLGEGGFGEVYAAQQTHPVKRRVALKILKAGMDTKAVLARFEAERQALALMDHPNIAKVLDAGETDRGRPYFVMDLVKGAPITEYCETHGLSVRERLELFIPVCQAVQHAHMKGIIHRDLKPSNILVTVDDGDAHPKVIDFGIAKATTTPLTDRTVYTQQGQLIGTPAYMSPEQAEMGALDVDTRTDVYSLGVVLYQLLTGGLPFDPERLSKVGYAEMQRILREEEPARPSTIAGKRTRGEASGEAGTDAPAPATDPRKLRGELDWIVLKAMSKDRTRRYETANGLAMDLRRFLRNEPVMAGPPSAAYRFRKFARRNRVALAVTGAILVTITGALIHTTIQRARVQAARDEAEAVTDFLSSMLSAVSPDEEGRDVTVREVLDVAAEDVGSEFSHQTAVQARLREVIGNTYLELGDLDRARALLEDALASQEQRLPPGHEQLISAQGTLGELYRAQGHYDEAEEILLRAVEASGGVDHPVVHSFPLLNSLIAVYFRQNRIEEGESLCVKVIENGVPLLGEGHREVRKARGNLASLYAGQKRYEEAHEMFAALLRSSRELYGDDHPDVLRRMSNLAFVEGKLGRIGESERLYREALERGQHVLGPEHPDVLRTRNNLAALLIADGQFAEAEPFITAVVEQSRTVLPDDLGFLGNTIAWRGECLRGLGRYEEAKSLLLQGHETLLEVYGESHARTRRAAGFLATLYENTGDSTKAGEWRARAKDPE